MTARPRSEYVADLVGMNLLRGQAAGTGLDVDGGGVSVPGAAGADRVRVRLDGQPTLSAEVPPGAVDEFKLDDGGQMWRR